MIQAVFVVVEGEVHADLPPGLVLGIKEVDLQGEPRRDRGPGRGGPGARQGMTGSPFKGVDANGMHPVRKIDRCQVRASGERVVADFFQAVRQYDAGDGGVAIKGVFLDDGDARGQHQGVCAGGRNHAENAGQADQQENGQPACAICS